MVAKSDVGLDIGTVKSSTLAVGQREATSSGTTTTGTATLNALVGKITTPSLTTVAGATHALTVNNHHLRQGDYVMVQRIGGTNTAGIPVVQNVVSSNGSFVINLTNFHAANAFNGTFEFVFWVLAVQPR